MELTDQIDRIMVNAYSCMVVGGCVCVWTPDLDSINKGGDGVVYSFKSVGFIFD